MTHVDFLTHDAPGFKTILLTVLEFEAERWHKSSFIRRFYSFAITVDCISLHLALKYKRLHMRCKSGLRVQSFALFIHGKTADSHMILHSLLADGGLSRHWLPDSSVRLSELVGGCLQKRCNLDGSDYNKCSLLKRLRCSMPLVVPSAGKSFWR